MSQSAKSHCDQQNCEHSNWPAPPTLLPFAGYKRKRHEHKDCQGRTKQEDRGFSRWGQEREESIQPQEEEVRAWSRLDDRRIRLASWTKGTKLNRAECNRNQNETGE